MYTDERTGGQAGGYTRRSGGTARTGALPPGGRAGAYLQRRRQELVVGGHPDAAHETLTPAHVVVAGTCTSAHNQPVTHASHNNTHIHFTMPYVCNTYTYM